MSTKDQVLSLKTGQKVWATVEDVLVGEELIVNYHGDLLRVANQSQRRFRPGQRIQLNVTSTTPLQFQLLEPRREISNSEIARNKIDIEI